MPYINKSAPESDRNKRNSVIRQQHVLVLRGRGFSTSILMCGQAEIWDTNQQVRVGLEVVIRL